MASYPKIAKSLRPVAVFAALLLLASIFAAPTAAFGAVGGAGTVRLAHAARVAGTPLAGRAATQSSPTTDDWPTSLHDVERTAASADTTIGTSSAPTLTKLWTFQTGGPVASTPTVTGGVAYFGSWDGYEYAVNATTGAQIWKTYLGVLTANPICVPPKLGISSPATVTGGTVYVGGGDGYWYALDAETGAVDWRVWVGGTAPGTYDGHYNWSGPLIIGNYAYVGIASLGDCPLIQGQLLKVNLTTHAIENTANLVPNGQVGGGIWTSPAYNPTTGLIYTATGTENLPTQQWAQAFLAIDPSTMEVVDSWKLPEYETVLDSDFGTSTTLFSANGNNMVAAINKNGEAYAFNQNSLASGPIWQQNIAVGGDCPTCGVSSVSSAAFGDGQLYMAGNLGDINGTEYPGTVRALNPATGAYIWQHAAPGSVIGALAYDNGMVLDGAGSVLEVLNATTGARLYSYDTGAQIYAGPSVADGVIYTGNTNGQVLAFELPSTPPAGPPPDPNCPSGYTCQDIGGATPAGSEAVSGSSWSVTAGGAGVGTTSDQFRMISEPTSGDAQVTAEITGQPTGGGSQAGVMIRQSNAPGSPYYAVYEEPGNTLMVSSRTAFGGASSITYDEAGPTEPVYLMVQRRGDVLQAATSTNGTSYTLIPGTNATVPMPAASLAGVMVSSGTQGTSGTAKVADVTVGSPTVTPQPAPSANACPSGWSCQDIGNPALVGNQALSGGTWTVSGAGGDIWASSDQFRYVWQSEPGDATVSADVASQSDTDPSAKAGVMLRGGTDPGAAYYAAYVTPGNGIQVQYRDTDGGIAAQQVTFSGAVPAYLEVARSGTSFTAYTSTNGSTWTPVQESTVSLPNLSGTILAGLAVTSHNTGTVGSATFSGVTVANTAPTPPNLCPTGYTCEDIGYPTPAGSQTLAAGVWSVQGGGGDMWGTSDQMRLISEPQAYNGTVSAEITSQTDTDPWAKSGLEIRLTDSPSAPYYSVLLTPGNGVVVQYRSEQNGDTSQVTGVAGATPIYLQITRSGDTFTAYTSTNGVNWTEFPGSAITISALSGTLLAGMVVCSHNTIESNTTAFSGLSITGTGTQAGLPYPWSDSDVGGSSPAGSANYADSTFTVQGGGNDVWGSTDQFNYVSQPITGDLSIVARVTSQTDTSAWAKSGVIIKQSTTAGSAYAAVYVTPGNGVNFQWNFDGSSGGNSYTFPNGWVRLDKIGNVFTAYTSDDGLNWVKVGQTTLSMTSNITAGLIVCSHNGSELNTTTFDNVAITPLGGAPLSTPWTNGDIGGPAIPGSASYAANGSVFTVNGSGSDIWGSVDELQYVSQPLTGNGTITARVTSQDITDPWAKSGIIIKQSTTAGSPYVLLAVTPGNGVHLQYGFNSDVYGGTFAFPNAWLRLQRSGNTFTAYTSPDGSTWTEVSSATVTMTTSATIGLFVCSHNNNELNTSTFDNVSVTSP
jgi:outer membrane protein assembly factor BamB/regulation of enolase protein 1 (concanavalin A-like superfamily)